MSGEGEETRYWDELLEALAEDPRKVAYRPRWNRLTGSVTATILLQQVLYWWRKNDRAPFYKFANPCGHPDYRKGDSWTEELGFTDHELRGARDRIATKLKRGESKRELLAGNLVIYWTDSSRKTFYQLNEMRLHKALRALYLGNRENRSYLEE